MQVKVKIDTAGLKRYRQQIRAGLQQAEDGPIRNAMKKWAARYRSFLQLRFAKFSRGGGEWPSLKAATIKRKRSSGILMDTGALRAALSPTLGGIPGQLEQHGPNYVMVGYGPGTHPKAKMAIDELAEIHQLGLGKNPKREIVVPPDRALANKMAEDMMQALRELGDQTGVS